VFQNALWIQVVHSFEMKAGANTFDASRLSVGGMSSKVFLKE